MSAIPRLSFFALVVALLLGPAEAVRAQDALESLEQQQQALFSRLAPAVVFIATADGFGSGFFVTPNGTILTNAHVVGNAEEVDLVLHDGRRLDGRVVAKAPESVDLALVEVDLEGTPTLPLGGMDDLRVGSWVASVGHGMGGIWTFTTGMVSNIYPAGSERPVFQTQIPLNPGNSGGPVVDRRGRVVGVVTAGIERASAINFAIRIDVARRSFKQLAVGGDLLRVRAPANVPVFVDGAMVGLGPEVEVTVATGTHEVFAVIGGEMRRRKVTWPEVKRVDLTAVP